MLKLNQVETVNFEELLRYQECEFIDFKQQYPSVNSDLIHDLLCLSNALTLSDRVLIFGVADDGTLHGVGADQYRRTQPDLITILRSCRLNKLPNFFLKTVVHDGKEFDVWVIKNSPDKPYFLTEDYTSNGRPLRAGVVYSRVIDTNIPVNSTSTDNMIERMYFERLGLDLSPMERVKKYLTETSKWKYGYNEEGNLYFYHELFPEFTVHESARENREKYCEVWSIDFPDQNASASDFFVKFNSTILTKVILIWLDGGRYKRIQPKIYRFNYQGVGHFSYYYISGSVEALVNQMILDVYGENENRDTSNLFPVFENVSDAEKMLERDFLSKKNSHIFYFYNDSQADYFRVENGKAYKVFWKR
ncbi:hypothetical protein C0V70_13450 [Bacteriovorax stolpii]|uniref:Uncharacterized protein n=1 Tax=Bacteriovorax stolpii TaxID=960 RepID=A0A2K9NUC4_BACTC|nr:ATP-binding protein [Bacteriovorax stolpii]AUN99087.1 hypothetical protein C0V70_13450 [Bacteriovorax stolpii]TDP55383.1 putative DNA-binding protein [Bacteriovorax stolpii]